MNSNAVLLNSWKEIAVYLGRGTRTAQRWELKYGLPVHRIGSGPRSPVMAYARELDQWLRNRVQVDSLDEYAEQQPFTLHGHRALDVHFATIHNVMASLEKLQSTIEVLRITQQEWPYSPDDFPRVLKHH